VVDALELTVDGPHGARTIRVSNPDKIYFPELGITKAEVVRYFVTVGSGILRALHERPTMLERWPDGVRPGAKLTVWQGERGDAFYQRRVPKGAPDWVQTVRAVDPDGNEEVCPTEVAVIAWAANLGTLTFHPWLARRPDLDHPDQLRIDLDPQPGTDFRDAATVAGELRALLDELGMVGYPKTSGKRGIHVYVPIKPHLTLAQVHRALIALGRELVRRMPQQVTLERFKKDRGEKVFLDHDQTAIASAYSIRPTPHARVSAPVTWDELTDVVPEDFDLRTMQARFAAIGDPHAGLDQGSYSLEPLIEMADRDDRNGGLR
jgi:DNA ligase D-like protein (predicted polymerase)